MSAFESGSDWVMCSASSFCKRMRCIRVVVNYFERVTIAILSLLKNFLGSMVWVAVGNFTCWWACVLYYRYCVCVCVCWCVCGMPFVSMVWVVLHNFTFGRACALMQTCSLKVHGFDSLLINLRTFKVELKLLQKNITSVVWARKSRTRAIQSKPVAVITTYQLRV